MLEPLAGKILLPVLGGSPVVWSTCIVFFQAMLLLGYTYAHLLSAHVPARWQGPIHIGVLAAAAAVLPLSSDIGQPGAVDQRLWLLLTLAGTVGLPFFALSATTPLLANHHSLYAASNAGSLLGLIGYLLLEPVAPRSTQLSGWSFAFWAVAALVAVCMVMAHTRRHQDKCRARTAGPRRRRVRTGVVDRPRARAVRVDARRDPASRHRRRVSALPVGHSAGALPDDVHRGICSKPLGTHGCGQPWRPRRRCR